MASLQQMEAALVKAHEAGDTQNATILANAIKEARGGTTQPQGDTSYATAREYGNLKAVANTKTYMAAANNQLAEGPLGMFQNWGRETIGNPIRKALGFDPIDQGAVNEEYQLKNLQEAQKAEEAAAALNYRSLTTDDIKGVGSFLNYAGQKANESLPYMAASIGSGGTATMPMMAGEVYEGLGRAENLTEEERVRLASAGGLFMAVLENLGVGQVFKAMPKEALGQMGKQGIAKWLADNGLTRTAKAFLAAGTVEGATEFGQENIKYMYENIGGVQHEPGEYGKRMKESTVGGFSGGGYTRGLGVGVVEAGRGLRSTNLDNISKGDNEALADVTRDLKGLAEKYPDRNLNKLSDAQATIDDLHTAYMKEFDALKLQAKENGIDVSKKNAEFHTAEKRAKNKVKNVASEADIDTLTQIDPNLGAVARKLNILTEFSKQGVKGGVSRYTDLLNPLHGLSQIGKLGRAQGGLQSVQAGAGAYFTSGATLLAPFGGRIIDAATGSRNRVTKAISGYSNAPGIDTSSPGQVQEQMLQDSAQRAAREATQTAANDQLKSLNIKAVKEQHPPTLHSPQWTMEDATGLNRSEVARTIRILKKTNKDLLPAIQDYERNLAVGGKVENLSILIRAVKSKAMEIGLQVVDRKDQPLTTQDSGAGIIKNPISYQATVNQAELTRNTAISAAPSPELEQTVNRIAAAKTRVSKKAILSEALEANPEHKAFLLDMVEPVTNFGPEVQSTESPGFGGLVESEQQIKAPVIETDRPFQGPMLPPTLEEPGKSVDEQFNDVIQRRLTENLPTTALEKYQAIKEEPEPWAGLHKQNSKQLTIRQKEKLINEALTEGFKVKHDADANSFIRSQQLITLRQDAGKRQVFHEIFHAVEDRLSDNEISILKKSPMYKRVDKAVREIYTPDQYSEAEIQMETLAASASIIQEDSNRGGKVDGKVAYVISRVRDLIESFLNLLDGIGFSNVNNVLDDIYTGKTYQQAVNQNYKDLNIPDIQYAKSDKPGGPMVAKRLKALRKVEEMAKLAKPMRQAIEDDFNDKMTNIATNLNIPEITPEVLKKTLSKITPSVDLGMVAMDYLKAIGVMNPNGVVQGDPKHLDEEIAPYREGFLALLKALQKAKLIGDFGVAFRTSVGGKMYPIHMLEPVEDGPLWGKAQLNNVKKWQNRATNEPLSKPMEINGHPLGSYENTQEFLDREHRQPLVINDKIYEMMDKMQKTPQTHRGLDLIYKKDGTTDSSYTLASAEAIKQYEDNKNDDSGAMSPVYMKRKAQDRLRVDALNGSASYQSKAGKAIWEFPNWEELGETGFEHFLHSLRDHFGISNELPYNQRAGWLFGSVGEYMDLAQRPPSEHLTEDDLAMPMIDFIVNAYGQKGSNLYSHTRGGTAKAFLDKQSGTTLYQKNHAVFDVAEHGFEMQRAAIELGRMRAFLENIIPNAKKIPSSQLFKMDASLEALQNFKSSYPVWFDGTSSAYQLHGVLTGDANLAKETNLGPMDPDGPGGDLYRPGADYLTESLGLPFTKTRKISKKFISNRRSYGQVKMTAQTAGQQEIAKSLPEFADVRDEETGFFKRTEETSAKLKEIQGQLELDFDTKFPGAAMAEGIARSIAQTMFDEENKDDFAIRVPLPDGDIAVYTGKLPDSAKKRARWELDKDKTISVPVFADKKAITGFAAFINHALDAYVQRELAKAVRGNGASGFMHTHDAFAVHAKNGELMRAAYFRILTDIAKTPVYSEILRANGLDPNSMIVKYNIMTPEGSQTVEMPMSQILNQIEMQKKATFGPNMPVNYYALS